MHRAIATPKNPKYFTRKYANTRKEHAFITIGHVYIRGLLQ